MTSSTAPSSSGPPAGEAPVTLPPEGGGRRRVRRRYPLDPLVEAMGLSMNQACLQFRISGTTQQEYRRLGVSERVADRLANAAGFHPFDIWPEMADHAIEDVQAVCARPDCDQTFIPTRPGHVACSSRCATIIRQRRHRSTSHGQAAARRSAARYYAEAGDYVRAAQRRRYAAQKAPAAHPAPTVGREHEEHP